MVRFINCIITIIPLSMANFTPNYIFQATPRGVFMLKNEFDNPNNLSNSF